MATAAVVARILTQYSDKGSKAAQKDIAKLEKKIAAFGKKAVKNFALASAAAGAFAIKIGMDAVKGAAADEKAQTSLAIAIRNNTQATEEAIAANTKYLDQLELQVAIDNDELIPALQRLVTATGDLSQAQNLLVLSTDIAAASGKDLGVVSTAVSKAINGQFGALTKLGLPIDKVALEQKDLNKIFSDFADISQGQASAAANTYAGRLKVLALSYNQVIDKLGYALMPLILDFVDYLTEPGGLLDSLDEWIETNETKLQESLEGVSDVFKLIIDNGDNVTKVLNGLVQISGFLNSSIVGIIKWGEALILAFGTGYVFRFFKKNFGGVTKEVVQGGKRFDVVSDKATNLTDKTAKVGGGFSTTKTTKSVGVIRSAFGALSGRVKVVLGLMALVGSGNIFSKIKEAFAGRNDAELLKEMQEEQKKIFQLEQKRAKEKLDDQIRYNKNLKIEIAREKDRAIAEAKRAADAKKRAAIEAKTAALKKRIEATTGLKITDQDEYDVIQLTAVEKLQKKQKEADESLKERIKLRKEELALFNALNENAQRYTDLLAALADDKLSTKEIELLAKKWGMSIEAAKTYIYTVFAIKDNKVSDDEVAKLAQAWGISTTEAGMYLDFISKLRDDGKISDSDLQTLMGTWKLTKAEAEKYKDVILKIENDGDISDKDITDLAKAWGVGNKEVLDYLNKIKAPATYSGTLFDPADIAFNKWRAANNELDAYLAKLKLGTGGIPTITPPVVTPPVVTPPVTTVTPQGPCGPSRPYYNYYTGECVASQSDIKPRGTTTTTTTSAREDASKAAAIASAVARAAGDIEGAAIAAAGVNPSDIASGESGAIGAASIAAQLRAAEIAVANANTLSAFRAKEAADAAAAAQAARTMEYDERFRFRSATMENSGNLMGSGINSSSAPVINITVQGSVTSENDLVQTVRTGLLAGQSNGNSLILQAI